MQIEKRNKITRNHITLDPDDGQIITLKRASEEYVLKTISGGRSDWVWITLPNGDLILGVFPYGSTYEAVKRDAI